MAFGELFFLALLRTGLELPRAPLNIEASTAASHNGRGDMKLTSHLAPIGSHKLKSSSNKSDWYNSAT